MISGKKFQELLKRYEITQNDAAKIFNISRSTVVRFLKMEQLPLKMEEKINVGGMISCRNTRHFTLKTYK